MSEEKKRVSFEAPPSPPSQPLGPAQHQGQQKHQKKQHDNKKAFGQKPDSEEADEGTFALPSADGVVGSHLSWNFKPDDVVAYICGDCGAVNTELTGDKIRCRDCGFKILYKRRVRKPRPLFAV